MSDNHTRTTCPVRNNPSFFPVMLTECHSEHHGFTVYGKDQVGLRGDVRTGQDCHPTGQLGRLYCR